MLGGLRHYDESSECVTARQHEVAEVACYRTEMTWMGCGAPLEGKPAHPVSVLDLTKNKVDGGSRHWPMLMRIFPWYTSGSLSLKLADQAV